VLDVLDAAAVRRWCALAVEALAAERAEIDALNVFPVADGDTGTNLYVTFEAAAAELALLASAEPEPGLRATTEAIARGAFHGASGNSGVILSQMLRGLAKAIAAAPALEAIDAGMLRRALAEASGAAYAAVGTPVEGTMLSVVAAAARAAAASSAPDLVGVARAAHAAARAALAASPDDLEILRRHGVVDAGGVGVVILLGALEEVVTGVRPTEASRPRYRSKRPAAAESDPPPAPPAGPAYEVMYLLDAPETAISGLRRRLGGLGDSLMVVGGDDLWHLHIHVDDVGAVIEAGLEAGRPHRIRVSHLPTSPAADCRSSGQRAVVAIVDGPGLLTLAEQAGAVAVPADEVTTSAVVHGAVVATGAPEVVLLAADDRTRGAAEAAANAVRAEGHRVALLPIRAAVQALAALAVHDPGRTFDDDIVAMTAAAAATRVAAVSVAEVDAVTMVGPCAAGDVLGLIEGEVVLIGADPLEVARAIVTRLLGSGGELVTLVHGRGGDERLAKDLARDLHELRPDVVCDVHSGGQTRELLLIGVE
jgi:DAK2 domain fusion protein YloV